MITKSPYNLYDCCCYMLYVVCFTTYGEKAPVRYEMYTIFMPKLSEITSLRRNNSLENSVQS